MQYLTNEVETSQFAAERLQASVDDLSEENKRLWAEVLSLRDQNTTSEDVNLSTNGHDMFHPKPEKSLAEHEVTSHFFLPCTQPEPGLPSHFAQDEVQKLNQIIEQGWSWAQGLEQENQELQKVVEMGYTWGSQLEKEKEALQTTEPQKEIQNLNSVIQMGYEWGSQLEKELTEIKQREPEVKPPILQHLLQTKLKTKQSKKFKPSM